MYNTIFIYFPFLTNNKATLNSEFPLRVNETDKHKINKNTIYIFCNLSELQL